MFDIPPSSQDARTFAIIGAAYEVHRGLGTGFLEIFYKDALEIEFTDRQIPFQRERPCAYANWVAVEFRHRKVGTPTLHLGTPD